MSNHNAELLKFAFCERNGASSSTPWCIRQLSNAGPKYGGGIDTNSLCGKVQADRWGGWDVDVEITEDRLNREGVACPECVKRYRELTQVADDSPSVSREMYNEMVDALHRVEDERDKLKVVNADLLMVGMNATGMYEAAKIFGLDRHLPGYDGCLRDLETAIANAQLQLANTKGGINRPAKLG